MALPTSVRFDEPVTERLASYVARHPGLTRSALAARYVDEGLRMDEHPGILFREGPSGRRATLVAGPDVWEVVRTVKQLRRAEPDMSEPELVELFVENTGVAPRQLHAALDYWAAYPDEVDAMVTYAETAEAELSSAADRAHSLLAR